MIVGIEVQCVALLLKNACPDGLGLSPGGGRVDISYTPYPNFSGIYSASSIMSSRPTIGLTALPLPNDLAVNLFILCSYSP